MMRRNITKTTQIKVLKYLEYIHTSSEAGHKKGYEILNLLSKRLKDVVYKEYYGRILIQFKLFSRKFSEKFLKTLSLYMKEQTLGPGEILYNEGELDQRLFYIQSGVIEQYSDLQENGHKDIVLQTQKQGDYFGQYGFLGNLKCKNSARSLNVSQLVYCTLEDFMFVIRQFPNDFETYCSLKDSIIFSEERLDVDCSGCGKYSHQVQNCPLLHYEIDKEAHIRRYIHSDPQKRDDNFSRNKPFFQKWASRMQSNFNNETASQQVKTVTTNKNKNYQYQRFNVFKEYQDLKVTLRYLRLKLADPEEKQINEDQLQNIYQEIDDRKFILETKVPIYQTLYLQKQKDMIKHGYKGIEDEFEDDDEDLYEEEFADYEDLMNNEHSQIVNPIPSMPHINQNQQIQRMSTLIQKKQQFFILQDSQIHVPTEKSLYIKMPSEHNFRASGMGSKVVEDSSEDYEQSEEEQEVEQNQKNYKPSSNRYIGGGFQVSFKDESNNVLKKKQIQQSGKASNNNDLNQFNQQEEEINTPQQKSLFYRGNDQQIASASPTRQYNKHKTVNPSSFNNLQNNIETYLRNSNLDNNASSMGSIVLNQQGPKRKGTVLSSIGQGSSKLKNQGSQDYSFNVQRTGTLNSKGIIRNSTALSSRKISDKSAINRSNTGAISKIDTNREQSKGLLPSSTQYAKFANTVIDSYSEKQKKNHVDGSQYTQQDSNIFKLIDFDRHCEFTHYLPWNNLSNIIKALKKIQKIKYELHISNIKTVKTFRTAKTVKYQNNTLANIQLQQSKKLNDTNYNLSSIVNYPNWINSNQPNSDQAVITVGVHSSPKSENKVDKKSFQNFKQ